MKDKLVLILSFTTVFALGCATASVVVTTAAAEPPPSGQEQCVWFNLGYVVKVDSKKLDSDIATHARTLPPGWHAVGGSYAGGSAVLACRGSN